MPKRLELSGKIVREGGMLVCDCPAIGQVTWAPSLEAVLIDAARMVYDHLDASRRVGQLEAELRRLGIDPKDGFDGVRVNFSFDTADAFTAAGKVAPQHLEFSFDLAS